MAQSTTKKASSTPAATPKTPRATTASNTAANASTAARHGRPPHGNKGKAGVNKENSPPESPLPSAPGACSLVEAPSSDPAAAPDNVAEENHILKEQLAKVQAQMAAAIAAQQAAEQAAQEAQAAEVAAQEGEILEIARPPGEVGSRRNGYNIQETMGLGDNDDLYCTIQRNLRTQVHIVMLDLDLLFRKQDVTKLSNIYQKMQKDFPYLTTKRFPANWALADMIKAYTRSLHKTNKNKGKTSSRSSNNDEEDDDDRDDDEEASQLTKKRRLADDK